MMLKKDNLDTESLWKTWLEYKDASSAEKLIETYMYVVDFHVERTFSHIPATFDKSELRSLGLFGLFDAIQKFDPDQGVQFDTYSSIRIHGAMMDGLRKEDWLPRSRREQTKRLTKTSAALEQRLFRAPTRTELAQKMQMKETEIDHIRREAYEGTILSMEQHTKQDETNNGSMLTFSSQALATQPDYIMENREMKEQLVQAIKELKKNEQLVISLYYMEELTFTEIGEVLGLSTSRISQIHKQSVLRLKKVLVGKRRSGS
jgi:RNA polymerase sigma factor for flagellar operon FliA